MGSRSATKLDLSGSKANYYLHWGSPCYQIPRLGQWVFETATRAEPLTVAGWEKWAAEINGDNGYLVAAKRYKGPDAPDLEHRYELTTHRDEFSFRYHGRQHLYGMERWKLTHQCNSVAELLEAGVEEVKHLRARCTRYRTEHNMGPEDDCSVAPKISELTEWLTECENRADTWAVKFTKT